MSTYLPTVDYLMRTANMTALKLRVDSDPRAAGGTWRSVVGDPNGRIFGSPGDALLGIGANPQIWFKFSGDHTPFGWGPLDASGLAAAVALLQTQVAQLQIDLTALQAQVNANTLAITNLQTDIANLTAIVGALNAAVVALGLQVAAVSNAPFVEFGVIDPSTPNARALTTTPTILISTLVPGQITGAVRANSIDNTLLADMPANTIKSNPTGVAADPQDLPVGASTVVGRGPAGDLVAAQLVTSQIANNQVDNTKAADMAANTIKANPTGVAGDPQDMAVAASTVVGRGPAGDLVAAQLVTSQIGNNQVDNTKAADMAANTIKANPTGVAADPQDFAVGASTVVGRGPAGDLVAAQLVTSQVANNQIDNTKAADMPATSVKVNPTAVAGDPQDLVAAADGFLRALGGLIIWSPTVPITSVARTIYEVDFSTLPNNTFANGPEIIDGKTWTVFSAAAAGTFDIQNGTGLRWIPAVNTLGVFNETNQTAAGLYIDLLSLIGSSFQAAKRYSFEFYYSARTLNPSTRIGPFLWSPAGSPVGTAARVRGGGVNNSAGTQVVFAQQQMGTGIGAEDVAAQNVFGITAELNGVTNASSGTWLAPGWPSLSGGALVTTNYTNPSTLNRGDTRLAITHSHIAQNPVVDTVVLHGLRVVEL